MKPNMRDRLRWNEGEIVTSFGATDLIRHYDGRWELSGLRHKYDDVRCAQFGLWRGARRAHPRPWGCNRRATKPQAKFGATRRAAGLFRPDFVARSSQIHCGICSSLTPRLGEKSLAANVIVFMPQTTKERWTGVWRSRSFSSPASRAGPDVPLAPWLADGR